jgi:16S rRNA (cytidine1402-2'-O)-methyltransferase
MAGTHLGELRDLPARSLDALRGADLLVFEEDRPARACLKAAGVHRDYLKYSEHGQEDTLAEVTATLKRGGWVVYMSDQGMPGLSDPGRDLAALAYRVGATVQVIPGPSSLTAAIAACPFDCWAFHFIGMPPREPDKRRQALEAAGRLWRPLIMMDTPYRLKHILNTCVDVFASNRRGFIALDISGPDEAYWLGSFAELTKRAAGLDGTLNFVLIVEDDASIREAPQTEGPAVGRPNAGRSGGRGQRRRR